MIAGVFALLTLTSSHILFAQESASVVSVSPTSLLRQGKPDRAVDAAEALLARSPNSTSLKLATADVCLRGGKIDRAIELFDEYLESEPEAKPYLWQRGIALAFAQKYKAGAEQFEVHRKVNPNDVENPAWHYLCVAKSTSVEKANKMVLPAPHDSRVPMAQIHKMLTTGDTKVVKDAIARLEAGTPRGDSGLFYGRLYLGLYADANGDKKAAMKYIQAAASDAPRHYMGDVARVYLQTLQK